MHVKARLRPFERVVRPALFALPPEEAHALVKRALASRLAWERLAPWFELRDPRLQVKVGGIDLLNPLGVAAGFDKDGDSIDSLQCLGFGYVVVGSVLPHENQGNPKPRIVRHVKTESLSNCFGLPSKGIEYVARRLRRRRVHRGAVMINIQAFTTEEYLHCIGRVEPWADAIEVVLVCPNAPVKGIDFTHPHEFAGLAAAIAQCRKPLFVKLPPFDTAVERDLRLEIVEIGLRYGIAGYTMPGSFVRSEPALSMRQGNVTGQETLKRGLAFVSDLYRVVGTRAVIKASGGVGSGADAFAAIAAGATTAELYTSLVYKGPRIARTIARELLDLMDENGVASITELRGSDVGAHRI